MSNITGGRNTASKWGGATRQNFDLASPSSGTLVDSDQGEGEPLTLAEKILYQAMNDYEKQADPKELYHLLDIQRKKKSLIQDGLIPKIATADIKQGPFESGSVDQEVFFRSYFDNGISAKQ